MLLFVVVVGGYPMMMLLEQQQPRYRVAIRNSQQYTIIQYTNHHRAGRIDEAGR